MTGTTKSGFSYEADDRILTDWRFTLAVTKVQNGKDLEKLEGANQMVSLLLGDEGYSALMDHIACQNEGYIPAETVMNEVTEILNSVKSAKN